MVRTPFALLVCALLAILALEATVAPAAARNGNCAICDDIDPRDRHCFRGDGTLKPNKRGCEKFYIDPVELSIETDLDFGRLVMIGEGRGSVLIDVQSGMKTVSGDLDDLGGIAMAGQAVVTGEPFKTVTVELPSRVTLRDPAGGEAELRDLVTDLPPLPALDEDGKLSFAFTGTLYTGDAISIGGALRGRVPITVDYD